MGVDAVEARYLIGRAQAKASGRNIHAVRNATGALGLALAALEHRPSDDRAAAVASEQMRVLRGFLAVGVIAGGR